MTQHLVEIFDAPGFIDDSFRTGWSLDSGSGAFTNQGTIAGDYARMSTSNDVHFKRNISTLNLETNTYPILSARIRGGQSDAYCEIVVFYTDDSYTPSGWFTPGTTWMIKTMGLTAGKTIRQIFLGLGWGEKYIDWDYIGILKAPPPDLSESVEEINVDLQTTVGVSGFRLKLLNDPPLTGVDVGGIVMIYLAGDGESLDEKLVKGRIIDRERGGEPDNPWMEITGESMDELLMERTYTDEFASATQISAIIQDIIDDQLPEFTRSSIDTTNITIKNRYDEERTFDALKRLAETATFATGEKGANFWVDPGDDFHFEKLGKWSCPHTLTDGSDSNPKNILGISLKETMKGNPKLANNLKLIWFEREYEPKNADSWTDVDTGLSTVPNWDVLCDLPENVTIQPNYVDVKSGNCSVEYYMSANPGDYLEMRLTLPSAIDITTFNRLKVWLKRQTGIVIDADGLNFYMETQDSWLGRYYKLENLAPPAADTWVENDLPLSSFTPVNSPCKWVTRVNIRIESSIGIGVLAVRIDRLRFERDEKYKTTSDATSQSKYGKRQLVRVVKTIKTDDFAQKAVNGMLEQLKRPLVTVQVKTKGKAQVGFRPPQQITVYSAKDGLNGAVFQVVSAKHRYVPEDIYQCDLELSAACNHDGTLEPEVVPSISPDYIGGYLSRLREFTQEQELSLRERDFRP